MKVSLRYFKDGFYEDVKGVVVKIDPLEQVIYLQTAEHGALEKDISAEIKFGDIFELHVMMNKNQ